MTLALGQSTEQSPTNGHSFLRGYNTTAHISFQQQYSQRERWTQHRRMNATGKTKPFGALADSSGEANFISCEIAQKAGLPVLNAKMGLGAIHGEAVKTPKIGKV